MEENEWKTAGDYLENLFGKAATKTVAQDFYGSERERLEIKARYGARRFRRKALGLWRSHARKTLDEFAEILVNTQIASSLSEAREIVPKIVKANSLYGIFLGQEKSLAFKEVKDEKGNIEYEIFIQRPVD